MGATLLIMAAGLGSRFGGDKQLVDVGPNGEAFLDFAIRDAQAAGADKVVIIVRSSIEQTLRDHLDSQHDDLDVTFVCQDLDDVPKRDKPWGTGHAVLVAKPFIDQPFFVVNADDYYGTSSYAVGLDAMKGMTDRDSVVVAFEAGRTLPAEGSVSRGVCSVSDDDRLLGIVETHGIARDGDVIRSEDPVGTLQEDTPVSMNMWGFAPSLMDHLETKFAAFLADHVDEPKTEFLLPDVVDELRASGDLDVRVVRSDSDWIGVTNPADLEVARERLANL